MSLKIRSFADNGDYVIWNNYNSSVLKWNEIGLSRKSIAEYLKEHPMPEDPNYGKDELLGDSQSECGVVFMGDVKESTVDYVEELIEELM